MTVTPAAASSRTLRRAATSADWLRASFSPCSLAAVVTRSSMIAMSTMQMPGTNASPTRSALRARTTGWPRPGPLMNAAMVAIDSAAIVVWLMPTMMVRFAIGSSTFASRCHFVCPIESVASSVVAGRFCRPWAAIRITGGSE